MEKHFIVLAVTITITSKITLKHLHGFTKEQKQTMDIRSRKLDTCMTKA
jgi:hypothetical protein